jgi:hypothetical protein
VAVINFAALGKIAWSVLEGGESGWMVLVPPMIGMIFCDLAVYVGVRYAQIRKLSSAAN